jgi:hypothetical protein
MEPVPLGPNIRVPRTEWLTQFAAGRLGGLQECCPEGLLPEKPMPALQRSRAWLLIGVEGRIFNGICPRPCPGF